MESYLIFNLHHIQYGIDASFVREIFLLPQLTPIPEAPLDIVGIVNLRGKIIPVMHLDLRLGNSLSQCKLTDSIVVLEWGNVKIGTIVNTVQEVIPIDSNKIETQIDYGQEGKLNPAFITGIAQVDGETILLLNCEALIRQPDAVAALVEGQETDREIIKPIKPINSFYDLCYATVEEQQIFRHRAEALAFEKVLEEETDTETSLMAMAVVSFNEEYFGIDLAAVREFIYIPSYTSIPCCPQHIVGNMNLRGEILTLVDIRGNLNLPTTTVQPGAKAVVVNVDGVVAGLPVNEVFDVTYVNPEKIAPVPIATDGSGKEYLRGTMAYGEKILRAIDLSKLFREGGLEVEEYV